jgi:hypothetical protein
MIDKQFIVERVRMVEIRDTTVIQRQIGEISVVGVLLNKDDFVGTD